MPPKPIFHSLIKRLQKIHKPEDLTADDFDELMGVTATIAFRIYMSASNTSPAEALQQAKQYISQYIDDYFEFLAKDFVENEKPQ